MSVYSDMLRGCELIAPSSASCKLPTPNDCRGEKSISIASGRRCELSERFIQSFCAKPYQRNQSSDSLAHDDVCVLRREQKHDGCCCPVKQGRCLPFRLSSFPHTVLPPTVLPTLLVTAILGGLLLLLTTGHRL